MARPTARTTAAVASILLCGVLLGYRLANYSDSYRTMYPQRIKLSASRHTNTVSLTAVTHVNATQSTSCRRLWKKGTSAWFDKKFRPDLLPVWVKENTKLPDDVAKWWVGLQGNADKDYVDALTKAFEVIPDPQRFMTRNLSTCLRCAVVGNSGNLRGSGYGELIDSHDAVIRINQAKTEGFEKDVGGREDYRLMYPESYMDIPAESNFVLLNFKILDIKWATSALTTGEVKRTYMAVRSKIKVPPSKMLFFNPELMWHIHHDWIDKKGRYPSSGTLGTFFALQFCDEVSLFGFGANSKGFWDHYWQKDDGARNSAFLKTRVHDSTHEMELITRLAEEQKITLFKGVR
ncbi:CMP-N-acetylneuraminate-beta-galactosamide-alpha-2,3-sialyltransferase 2-like [Diadema setosum]|uniref:CMP-N-acetylneuraminate-beta-galactosamide- alpha-2,3-sialyltransferase 2-like n=1 Tax=Diadema setosum TaxID=31175 RepID=UPI003B3BE0EB